MTAVSSLILVILFVSIGFYTYQAISIDMMINNIDMMLTFGICDKYFKILCRPCIKTEEFCNKWSTKMTQNEINMAKTMENQKV